MIFIKAMVIASIFIIWASSAIIIGGFVLKWFRKKMDN